MSITPPAPPFILDVHDVVPPPAPGPAGPACRAAGWSPARCRTPAGRSHEAPSGWAGWRGAPGEKELTSERRC